MKKTAVKKTVKKKSVVKKSAVKKPAKKNYFLKDGRINTAAIRTGTKFFPPGMLPSIVRMSKTKRLSNFAKN